jgi:hypothetical protein
MEHFHPKIQDAVLTVAKAVGQKLVIDSSNDGEEFSLEKYKSDYLLALDVLNKLDLQVSLPGIDEDASVISRAQVSKQSLSSSVRDFVEVEEYPEMSQRSLQTSEEKSCEEEDDHVANLQGVDMSFLSRRGGGYTPRSDRSEITMDNDLSPRHPPSPYALVAASEGAASAYMDPTESEEVNPYFDDIDREYLSPHPVDNNMWCTVATDFNEMKGRPTLHFPLPRSIDNKCSFYFFW